MAVDWLGFGYAALVASGGIIGYAKAGSVPSLAAGVFFGSLAGLGAYQVSQNPNNVWVSLTLFTGSPLPHLLGRPEAVHGQALITGINCRYSKLKNREAKHFPKCERQIHFCNSVVYGVFSCLCSKIFGDMFLLLLETKMHCEVCVF
uniref:Transmembrane protein 14C n=1 Tax=Malurus cyaneus samueli TaxID=2593467 RepID=A0A8C5T547_9PASS